MSVEQFNYKYKRLLKRIIVATIMLFLVFFIKQVIISYQIRHEINSSYIINTAGRQRMLSQKISKDIILIKQDINSDQSIKDLKESLDTFKISHYELIDKNQDNQLLKAENIKIIKMFDNLENSFIKIITGGSEFLYEFENNKVINDSSINKVIDNEKEFLKQMDMIVYGYEEKARNTVKFVEKTQVGLFGLLIALLIFIIFNVFVPIIKYVNESFNQVSESNDNLLSILQTISGYIFVVNKDGNILFKNSSTDKVININEDSWKKWCFCIWYYNVCNVYFYWNLFRLLFW